jgi:stage II sporulation protein R
MYKALRIKIGEAKGHNWWCVMYPPLCLPMADKVVDSEEVKEEFFTDDEIEIMEKPKKFRVRFMLWDKLKACFFDKKENIS